MEKPNLLTKTNFNETAEIIISKGDLTKGNYENFLIRDLQERYGNLFPKFCESVEFYYVKNKRTAFQAIMKSIEDVDKQMIKKFN